MRLGILGLVVATLIVPGATAQQPVTACSAECRPGGGLVTSLDEDATVTVFLYSHFRDHFWDGALTTQWPSAEFDPPIEYGALSPRLETSVWAPTDLRLSPLETRMLPRSSPMIFDQYEAVNMNHPVLEDVVLGDGPITVYGYFSVDAHPQGEVGVGAAPRVRVGATIEEFPHVNLASGSSREVDMVKQSGVPGAFEVAIPLEATVDRLGADPVGRWFVRTDVVQLDAAGNAMAQRDIRLRASADMPWRVILPVRHPLYTVDVIQERENGTLRLEWVVQSVFGSYDIDPASVELRTGRGTSSSLLPDADNYAPWLHDGAVRPVSFEWSIDADSAAQMRHDGVRLAVRNLQGTYELLADVELLEELEAHLVPDASFLAALALLAGAAARRRLKTQ